MGRMPGIAVPCSAGDKETANRKRRRETMAMRITRPGDVLLVLSLGGFDKLAPRLRDALEAQGVRR